MRQANRFVPLLVALTLVTGALVLPSGAPSAEAAFAGPNGLIAFQRNDLGDSQIWVMTPNGSGQVELTSAGKNTQPSWSPDGKKIAFASERDGNAEIYVMNADGSAQTRLTDRPDYDASPTWSPDGQRIAFQSFGATDYDIWVMGADGSDAANLTSNAAEDLYPTWQPGGSTIAFQTNRDGDREIYTVDDTGANLTNVSARPSSEEEYPDWSPDGAKISFTRNGNLWVMNADGSDQATVTTSATGLGVSWAPGGSKIAFVSGRDFNDEIYTVNLDGTGLHRLTHNARPGDSYAEDWFPDWQPSAVDPLCDLSVATEGGPPSHDGLSLAIGQEFGVFGDAFPAELDIELAFLHEPSEMELPFSVPSDADGHFEATLYFEPSSEGVWALTSSFETASVCRDTARFDVVTGHSFTDIAGYRFEAEIAWLFQRGITGGCSATRFCPNASVTREQMAAFLVRALDLPATNQDFFVDDETSTLENSINRLAASGITGGCAPGRFCPKAVVTREQMASFLARGLELPPTDQDFFVDDMTSPHEMNINRLAASGITGGCTAIKYCPKALVTRGQMAAFLERALFSVGTSSGGAAATSTDDASLGESLRLNALTHDGGRR